MSGQNDYVSYPLILATATIPYLIFNLGLASKARKIFMGDAGSMFIGLSVIWLLTMGTQNENASFRPVTALWICAVPLMDMLAIVVRRYKNGKSPFKPDRDHLHHILQRVGYSSRKTLLIISISAVAMSIIGLAGEYFNVPDIIMLTGFIFMFVCYVVVIRKITKFERVK
jgi:UDP-GlcNAc:undecaprenyl-phosphate GlcNAc-1-phosphate transferase